MFIFVPHVNADCDNDRINELKNLAKNVEITYELDENKSEEELKAYDPDSIAGGVVKIIITGLTEGLSITDEVANVTYNYDDTDNGIIVIYNVTNGSRTFKVYSTECDKKVRTLFIKIPTYNKYSLDPLCQNIPKEELSVCNTWYESTISYDEFKKKVENYNALKNPIEPEVKKNKFDEIIELLKKNYLYIVITIVLLIVMVILAKLRRKRSELE